MTQSERAPLPIVVLLSGSGSNLQAIIDAVPAGLPVDIRAVISNKMDAYGLERARQAGIPTQVLSHRDYADRESYDAALAALIDGYGAQLVVLAGFMRILSDGFVRRYEGRMLNIHPSLLPRHRGLDTHTRALAAGDGEHGATVHFVSPELDAGPIIIQARVPVHPGDTPESLAARVLEQEHRIYPQAIRWYAEGRLELKDGAALLDGKPVTP
ncbi:MAG: phosphoribosylglycinamide formyltransferase [Gammaproteobacteria bacterium HGW-Gammaproteobacteria-1]|jgi:phosphoribosylglycinamide formyltransferase-1|nr:MAG: phosphoribosylglycinamide formyltransferase [Gammaproteobacteria bacterium HGW-Gammaproteobacteria-1]